MTSATAESTAQLCERTLSQKPKRVTGFNADNVIVHETAWAAARELAKRAIDIMAENRQTES